MSDVRPPSLTRTRRQQIEEMLQVGPKVVDRLKGDPKSDDFKRVYAIGMQGLVDIKKIELAYMERFAAAGEARDTTFMLAAVYGLHKDLHGTPRASDLNFVPGLLSQAFSQLTDRKMRLWLDEYGQSSFDTISKRKALLEYLEEKLQSLDELVASRKPAPVAVEPEAEAEEEAVPGLGR